MKRSPLILIFLLSLLFTGCSTEGAEKIADEFHQKLDEGDHDYIINNLSDKDGNATEEEWRSFLELVSSWGPQTNRQKKIGFSNKINNGIKTVKLNYTFETETYGLIHERIILIERGGGYKVLAVFMDSDESVVERQTEEY